MARSHNPLIFDADVLTNWLTREQTATHVLWKAPLALMELGEAGTLDGCVTLTTLLELRALLRRKKGLGELTLRNHVDRLTRIVRIVIPDTLSMLRADRLQTAHPLSAFDAILLAATLTANGVLVTRDEPLRKIAGRFVGAQTPELALARLKR